MRIPSLVHRLEALQQLLAVALILAFACSTLWIAARTLERQETVTLENAAAHMSESLDREWREEGDLERAAAAATEEDAPLSVEFDVLDARGRRVFTTARGRHASVHRRSLKRPLSRGGWVVASISTEPRRRALSALATALALTAIPLVIGVTAVARVLARRALKPLQRITVEAEEATRRGVLRPLESADDPTEVATLATAFDRLFARLDEALRAERHFTEDAAHELRTPLTVLSGELELALQDRSLPAGRREGLARAWDQAMGLSDLVEALLLLRQSESAVAGSVEAGVPVNLADLARDVAREMSDRFPARAADVEVVAADEALVAGHATLLASAVRNLLANALKFTHAREPVRMTVSAQASRCEIVVEDAGPGIPDSDRERVFDPFYRGGDARAESEGFGLGLPILRRVARAHGGDVTLSESPLGGARFRLYLPAWRASA